MKFHRKETERELKHTPEAVPSLLSSLMEAEFQEISQESREGKILVRNWRERLLGKNEIANKEGRDLSGSPREYGACLNKESLGCGARSLFFIHL